MHLSIEDAENVTFKEDQVDVNRRDGITVELEDVRKTVF